MSPKHPLAKDSPRSPWHLGGAVILLLVLALSIRWGRSSGTVVPSPGSGIPTSATPFPGYPPPASALPPAAPFPTVSAPSYSPAVNAPAVQPPAPGSVVTVPGAPVIAPQPGGPAPVVANSLWKAIFPLAAVNAILTMPDGTTWAAHEQGLARVSAGNMVNFSYQSRTFPAVNATSLAFDGRNLWVGTFDGLVQVSEGSNFRRFTTRDGLIHDMVWSLTWDGAILWAGTQAGISFMTADGRFERVDKKISNGGLADIWIGALKKIDRWVCCGNDDGLSIWDTAGFAANPNAWITLDMFATNLSHNWILAIAQFEDKLWVGTPKGLSRLEVPIAQLFQPGQAGDPANPRSIWTVFNTGNGLPSERINTILPWKGALWIGTQAGLCRWQNGGFRVLSTADGLLASDVRSLGDGGDVLWVGTSRGLQALSPIGL